jgi:hypothetical protein
MALPSLDLIALPSLERSINLVYTIGVPAKALNNGLDRLLNNGRTITLNT